jgi:hypothetical protein
VDEATSLRFWRISVHSDDSFLGYTMVRTVEDFIVHAFDSSFHASPSLPAGFLRYSVQSSLSLGLVANLMQIHFHINNFWWIFRCRTSASVWPAGSPKKPVTSGQYKGLEAFYVRDDLLHSICHCPRSPVP